MPRLVLTTWPTRVDPPTSVMVPRIVAIAPVEATHSPGDGWSTHPAVLRGNPDDGCHGPQIEVSVRDDFLYRVGPSLFDAIAELTRSERMPAGGIITADDPDFMAEKSLGTKQMPPELFLREFLSLDALSFEAGRFAASWGPFVLPPATINQPEVFRRILDPNPHRDQIHQVLEAHADTTATATVRMGGTEGSTEADAATVTLTAHSSLTQSVLQSTYQAVFETVVHTRLMPDFTPERLSRRPSAAVRSAWERRRLPVAETLGQAVDTALDLVTAGASGFGPRLQLVDVEGRDAGPQLGHTLLTILPALCLQAIHFVSAGAPIRRCPVCDHWFSRHQGRAQFEPKRNTRAIYCSERCTGIAKRRGYRQRHPHHPAAT